MNADEYEQKLFFFSRIRRHESVDPETLERVWSLSKKFLVINQSTYQIDAETYEDRHYKEVINGLFQQKLISASQITAKMPYNTLGEILGWIFIVEFILSFQKIFDPSEMFPNGHDVLLGVQKIFENKLNQEIYPNDNELARAFLLRLKMSSLRFLEWSEFFTTPYYQKRNAEHTIQTIKEELIQVTWHPSRIKWWMPFDEYQEIFH